MVINLPILKDHGGAGITFAMKNMFGVVDQPWTLHANHCDPGVADLNCIPAVRDKVWFTVGDAISSVYDGGPGFRPERLWYPNALVVAEDRVAIDQTAWQIIEHKRAEAGMPTLEAVGRPPKYIARRLLTPRTALAPAIRNASVWWKCNGEWRWQKKPTRPFGQRRKRVHLRGA